MRLVVDADCLVAGVLTAQGATTDLLNLWREGGVELAVCAQLLDEVRRTLASPRVGGKYGFVRSKISAFVDQLSEEGEVFENPSEPPRVVPNDQRDDYLVALTIDAGADYLVTRDAHFDSVRVEGVRIITPGRLMRELQ